MYIYFEYTFTKKRMKKWMQFIQHRRLIQQFDLYILRCYVWSLILLHTWNFEGTVGRRSMDLRMKLKRSIVYTPIYHMYLHYEYIQWPNGICGLAHKLLVADKSGQGDLCRVQAAEDGSCVRLFESIGKWIVPQELHGQLRSIDVVLQEPSSQSRHEARGHSVDGIETLFHWENGGFA